MMDSTRLVVAAAVLLSAGRLSGQTGGSYDVVVYGGTAGGVITAVSAARMGLKTALLDPARTSAAWWPRGFRTPMWGGAR